MTIKKLGKIVINGIIFVAVSVSHMGCGLQKQNQTKESAVNNSIDLRKNSIDTASLALSLPTNLPANVDIVEVSLSRLDAGTLNSIQKVSPTPAATSASLALGVDRSNDVDLPECLIVTNNSGHKIGCLPTHGGNSPLTVSKKGSQINKEPIKFKDLKAGEYSITVRLSSSANGSVYSQGEGKATVQAGKEVTARISMTKVEDNTGGLVIIFDDSTIPPQGIKPSTILAACTSPNWGAFAICAKDGNSFKIIQPEFAPNQCNPISLPNPAEGVDWDNCRGLPGYQHRYRAP